MPEPEPKRKHGDAGIVVRVFERFTDRARTVIDLAQEDARVWGGYVATENILLGLALEGSGLAATVLASFGTTAEDVRLQTREFLGAPPAEPTPLSADAPPFTPRAEKVLELSRRESEEHGDSFIDTEHILLGIIREGEGVAVGVLGSLGIDLDVARRRVLSLMSGAPMEQESTGIATGSTITPPFATPQLASAEPRCPKCRAYLTVAARFRTLLVPSDSEEGTTDPLPTHVVYCRICGSTLEMFTAGP
jgi:ATP-dependent Clp protease ATP-binding subunit ClpA